MWIVFIYIRHTRIPKHLISDNTNMLILFKQDEHVNKHGF